MTGLFSQGHIGVHDFRYAVCVADFHTGDVAVADQEK